MLQCIFDQTLNKTIDKEQSYTVKASGLPLPEDSNDCLIDSRATLIHNSDAAPSVTCEH